MLISVWCSDVCSSELIDARDLYSLRGSLRFEPGPDTTIDLMGYYFREKDTRLRNQKQTCQRDPLGVLGCLNNRRDFDTTNANSTVGATLSSSEFFAIQGIPAVLGLGSRSEEHTSELQSLMRISYAVFCLKQ